MIPIQWSLNGQYQVVARKIFGRRVESFFIHRGFVDGVDRGSIVQVDTEPIVVTHFYTGRRVAEFKVASQAAAFVRLIEPLTNWERVENTTHPRGGKLSKAIAEAAESVSSG